MREEGDLAGRGKMFSQALSQKLQDPHENDDLRTPSWVA